MKSLYSVALYSANKIKVFDINKGVISFTISLGDVTIVNGPIVLQDKMTVIVKTRTGATMGKVYSLPKGVLSYSFHVK
jgi:hypothetical protein